LHFFLLILLCTIPTLAAGQTLSPDRFETSPSQPITLSFPSPSQARVPAISWFFVRLAGTQENRDSTNAPPPNPDGTLPVTLALSGIALIGLDLAPETMQWDPETFAAFAKSCGDGDRCPTGASTVERRISAATLVRVSADADGEAESDSTAMSKAGLAAEVRPLMDPTVLGVGSDLPLRFYIDGEAIIAVRVTATHKATGTTRSSVTDAKGMAFFRIDHAGPWTVEFHTLAALTAPTDPNPVWRATSGSLTFAAPTAAAETEVSQ